MDVVLIHIQYQEETDKDIWHCWSLSLSLSFIQNLAAFIWDFIAHYVYVCVPVVFLHSNILFIW